MRLLPLIAAAATLISQATWAASASVPRGIDPRWPLADLVVTRWSTEDGLPTNVLLTVRRLSAGDLWVAGFGGLARFDGIHFETFDQTAPAGVHANSFYDLLEDDGRIWVATQAGGLWKLEDDRLSPLAVDTPQLSLLTLMLDRAGTLWVGAAEKGAFRLEGGALRHVGHPSLSGVTVRAILEDRDGDIWFGTENHGLVRRSAAGFAAVGPGRARVNSLFQTRDGQLWIGATDGLGRWLDGEILGEPELAGVEVFGIAEDDYGSLWVAAEQGLFRRAAGADRFDHVASLGGHSLRSLNEIAFDHEGGAWVSSYANGLFHLRAGKFTNYGVAAGLSSRRVNSVYESGDGRILVGGDLGTVDVIADGGVSRLDPGTHLPEVRVRSFYEDRRGTLWISSYAGLLRVRGADGMLLTTESGLPVNQVRLVFEDAAGTLWIATRGAGLVRRLPGGGFESIGRAEGLASDFVLSIDEDPPGRLLVGTQAGLTVRHPDGAMTVYSTADGLPGDLVFNTFVDRRGAVWIATTGGLARLDGGEIGALTRGQGLPADAIYDFWEDERGYAWMSSGKGVVRVLKAEIEQVLAGARPRIQARLLDRADGLTEPQCTGATSMAVSADGRLWIPTLGGLAVIDPARVTSNPVPPPIAIRRLAIDGESVPLPRGNGEDAVVVVPPGRRRFVVSFSALSFQAPRKMEVRYRLDGFDRDWIDAGTARSALYTGLPPGRYSFRLRAANNDGVWSPGEARLDLRVRPEFRQTAIFFALVAAALLLGPWGVYRWRVARARRRGDELERLLAEQRRLESERTRLISELEARNEQLENFTYAVSHDLKSPLYTIRGFVELLEKDHASGDEERFALDLMRIRQATDAMSRLLAGLLELRRIDKADRVIEEVDLRQLALRAVEASRGRLDDRGVAVDIAGDLPRAWADATGVVQVLQNLVDNAAAHMGDQPQPRIVIGCRRDDGELVLFVRDNGVGIEPRYQQRIFRLFERLTRTVEGSGMGLAIVKRVVEGAGGRVWVESQGLGTGATFCFTLGTTSRGAAAAE